MQTEFYPLFKEICRADCYRLRKVPFVPDVIFDIGANVGVFTSYARFLFPRATIISVEPNPRNWELLLRHTGHLPDVWYAQKALGVGKIWHKTQHCLTAPWYGGMESYVSQAHLGSHAGMRPADEIVSVSLDALVATGAAPADKLLVKIDIEGGEDYLPTHRPSMEALRRIDYLTMELHPFATVGDLLMHHMADTHDCFADPEHNYFQATRRGA